MMEVLVTCVIFGLIVGWTSSVSSDVSGAVPGRIVSVPVYVYSRAFRVYLELGQCPYFFEGGTLKTCSSRFEGETVFLAKGSMEVSSSRVQSTSDIITYGMGSMGVTVGVLGLISVSPKVTSAVTTETSRKNLNLMTSYDMTQGVLTLQNVRPTTTVPDEGSLYLSEIELGGNELLLVTLEFESEKQNTEVQVSVTFKILFWSITAKLNYIYNELKINAKARVQFQSSWREPKDRDGIPSLQQAIPIIEKMEEMFMRGPQELRRLRRDNVKLHSQYHFASWKQSPYGEKFNVALINHDLDSLSEQKTEMESVAERINTAWIKKLWSVDQRRRLNELNATISEKSSLLTNGLLQYHKLDSGQRQELRHIYNKAPLYYSRQLNAIMKE